MVASPSRPQVSPTTIAKSTQTSSSSSAYNDGLLGGIIGDGDTSNNSQPTAYSEGRCSSTDDGGFASEGGSEQQKQQHTTPTTIIIDGPGGREGMPPTNNNSSSGVIEDDIIISTSTLTAAAVASPSMTTTSKIPKNPRDTDNVGSNNNSANHSPVGKRKGGSIGAGGGGAVLHFNNNNNNHSFSRRSIGGGGGSSIGGSSINSRRSNTNNVVPSGGGGGSSAAAIMNSFSSSSATPPFTMVSSSNTTTTTATGNRPSPNNVASAALDDDEQYMFEQRLTHDELGVAIRKISHSGKAQLRYVKCVPIRPPSSSDYVGVDEKIHQQTTQPLISQVSPTTNTNTNHESSELMAINNSHTRLNNSPYNQERIIDTPVFMAGGSPLRHKSSDSVSVSSKASTSSRRILDGIGRRISRLKATTATSTSMTNNSNSNASNNNSSNNNNNDSAVVVAPLSTSPPSIAIDDLSNNLLLHDDDVANMSIMLADSSSSSSHHHHHHGTTSKTHRALTWGKKNAVIVSLDKFICVRKGKTTDRTVRNSSPGSRLLSIITTVRGNESLDIEAPTMLDRDKFASAFARFLGVPLVEEDGWVGNNNTSGVGSGGAFGSGFAIAHDALTQKSNSGGGGGRTGRSMAASVGKKIRTPSLTRSRKKSSTNIVSAAKSEPGIISGSTAAVMPTKSSTTTNIASMVANRVRSGTNVSDSQLVPSPLLRNLTPNSEDADDTDNKLAFDSNFWDGKETIGSTTNNADPATSTTTLMMNGVVTRAVALSPAVVGGAATMKSRSSSRASGDTVITKQTLGSMSESVKKRISLDVGQTKESILEPKPQQQIVLPQDATFSETRGSTTAMASNNSNPATLDESDNHSHVSSLTGGVDQEIVEELHQAIIELRTELDASRAEAARAVKVAEQAIQSAENCTSSDWNSTVTHKAAEAAAQAQRKSAEAIARARVAEDRLNAERKSTKFWRRQAQSAEEEAGSLKTRSAAAEVRQAVMMEELASERRKAARMFASLKKEFKEAEKKQEEDIANLTERRRVLEVELDLMKKDVVENSLPAVLPTTQLVNEGNEKSPSKGPHRMSLSIRRSINHTRPKRADISSPLLGDNALAITDATLDTLRTELTSLRKKFEFVRHSSVDDIELLRRQTEGWSIQASRAIASATAETDLLREKYAAESAMRLKLLNSLQDIRGTVRVYCRPKPSTSIPGSPTRGSFSSSTTKSIIKIPTHDILVLNEDISPVSFKYDRVFAPGASQYEVFSELEEPLLSSLDGFNVTLLAFGQGGSGKTHTLLGDVIMSENENELPFIKSYGVQLQAILQLFTIAGHRTDRYKDAFSLTMVEVHNEKLFDLVSGTPFGEENGEAIMVETRDHRRDSKRRESSADAWPKGKLEIRTNIDGNTVVQGLVSIPITSFEDVITIWQESIACRSRQLRRQGSSWTKHGHKTNIITTIHITSVNIATGVGTEGRLQFVDMAASDLAQNVSSSSNSRLVKDNNSFDVDEQEEEIQFANKSIDAFSEVINARCQFDRSVPYRNSTLTHLLRDSLEADTKVLLLCCISSDEANLADTIGALRFASRMQKVSIGKATKHVTGNRE